MEGGNKSDKFVPIQETISSGVQPHVLSELNLEDMFFMGRGAPVIIFYRKFILSNDKAFSDNTRFGDLFNEIIKRIREGVASPRLKTKLYRRIARSRENYQSACLYIESLFAAYSRLVIVRIDLIYRSEFAQRVTIEEARKDREHFLNNMRGNHLFSHLAEYLWKLEDGEQRGLHYHFIFFLDGSHKIKASYYANEFGKYWAEIVTKGRGYFHNCHTSKSSYKNYGIGVINHYESDKRANLTGKLLEYISKTSQYLEVIGGRFFGHGEIAKREISKDGKAIGRPRKYES